MAGVGLLASWHENLPPRIFKNSYGSGLKFKHCRLENLIHWGMKVWGAFLICGPQRGMFVSVSVCLRAGLLYINWHNPTPVWSLYLCGNEENVSFVYYVIFLCISTHATVNYWKCLKNWPFVSYFPFFFPSSYLHHSVDLPHIYTVSLNQSSHAHEYPDCQEGGNEASLLVSPLVVAGIVIGLVLFLSCVTIIVGSLRKDSRLHNPHLRASYGQWSNFMGSTTYQIHTMALFVVSVWHNDMHKLICFQKAERNQPFHAFSLCLGVQGMKANLCVALMLLVSLVQGSLVVSDMVKMTLSLQFGIDCIINCKNMKV